MKVVGGAAGSVAPGCFHPIVLDNVGAFPRGHIHRKRRQMKSPMNAIKEPIERANMASLIALGIALVAIGLAFAAMSKATAKAVAVLWLSLRLL